MLTQTLYKSKLANTPLSTLETELANCRKVLMDLQNLKTKCSAEAQKYERTRACIRDVVGRGPISELEREELRTAIKKLNSMIEQLGQNLSPQSGRSPLQDTEHSTSDRRVRESYKSLLAGCTLFRAIFK